MFTHSSKPVRHALDLLPTHIRSEIYRRRFPNKKSFTPQRGAGVFRIPSPRNQRSIVKISYTLNTPTRSWAAHGHYLQREHAQTPGQPGCGFNAERNDIDLKSTLRQWQQAQDEHVFKLIVSPENGYKLDLKLHAIELMRDIEKDLKTKLEWAAIDHHNTDHPHLHVLIRGRDEKGNTLTIEKDYLARGIRYRSEERVTRKLGLRLDSEMIRARGQHLEQEHVTHIDRSLRHKAVNSIVSYHTPVPDNLISRELRLQEIGRLKFLEKLGLAEKVDRKSWKLSNELESTLHSMQLSRDIIKSRARHNIRTLTYEMPSPTVIQPNKPLTGKVVGMGLEDELKDKRYLLLEGIDGKVHYIKASSSIIKARDNQEFFNNNIITLERKDYVNAQQKVIEHITINNHFTLQDLHQKPHSRLNDDVFAFVKTNGIAPQLNFPEKCFAQEYAKAMHERFHQLVKEKVIIKKLEHYHLAPAWKRQLERVNQQRQHYLPEHKPDHQLTKDQQNGQKKQHQHSRDH